MILQVMLNDDLPGNHGFFQKRKDHFVINFDRASGDIIQFSPEKCFSEGADFVYKQDSFQVVVFMLNDAGGNTFKDLFMFMELFILVSDPDPGLSDHIFMDIGDTQASFVE